MTSESPNRLLTLIDQNWFIIIKLFKNSWKLWLILFYWLFGNIFWKIIFGDKSFNSSFMFFPSLDQITYKFLQLFFIIFIESIDVLVQS